MVTFAVFIQQAETLAWRPTYDNVGLGYRIVSDPLVDVRNNSMITKVRVIGLYRSFIIIKCKNAFEMSAICIFHEAAGQPASTTKQIDDL
jgi:hypothetical protein